MNWEWINNWVPQIGAGVCGFVATLLVSTKGKYRNTGYLIGVIGQPFWYWMTAYKGQWVIFALSILYTATWLNGFRNHFLKKAPTEPLYGPTEAEHALHEALEYMESDRGPMGDLSGCAVPHRLWVRWHKIVKQGEERDNV